MTDNDKSKLDDAEDAADDADFELTPEDFINETSAAEAEIAELNDRILRIAAELDNTRRRAEREKADASRFAITSFARDLVNVADTFERALASAPAEGETATPEAISAFVAGLKMTDKELLAVLERHGVRRIDPKGEKFDPNMHQAVAQAPGDAPSGFVLDVAQPGFVIGERVLRAAMVIVSTGGGAKPGGEPQGETPEPTSSETPSTEDPPPTGSRLDTRA